MDNRSNPLALGSSMRKGRGAVSLKALALVTILALLLVASGCGSSSSSTVSEEDQPDSTREKATQQKEPSPLEAVQVAYKTTASRDTARFASTIDISGMPATPAQPAQANGAETAEMRLDSQGVVDFADGSYALTMQMPYLGQIQSRQIGDTLYQKYPPEFQAQLTGGKPWAKVDLDALSQQQYGMAAAEPGAQSTDPTQQLAYLKSVSDSVEKVGKDEIRGVSTTHYRAAVNLGKNLEQYDQQARKAYEEIIKELDGESLPVDVWLDDEGQVRRYEMTMPLILPENPSSPNGAVKKEPGGSITIVQELYDFGTSVNVEAPPTSQTADVTDMMAEQNSMQL
jgi:hypothetical protein